MGQPPLGVAVAGPGIAEVDIDAVYLTRSKEQRKLRHVPIHKKDVVQFLGADPLHGDHHGVRHPFHRNIERLWILRRSLRRKAALAAAQLQKDLLRLGHQLPPLSLPLLRVGNQHPGTAFHPHSQVRFFSHSHSLAHLVWAIISYQNALLQSFCLYIIIEKLTEQQSGTLQQNIRV